MIEHVRTCSSVYSPIGSLHVGQLPELIASLLTATTIATRHFEGHLEAWSIISIAVLVCICLSSFQYLVYLDVSCPDISVTRAINLRKEFGYIIGQAII